MHGINGSADTTDRFAIDRSGNITCGGTIGTSPATTLNNDGTSFFTNLMTITRAGNAMRVNSTGAGNRDTIELGNEISDGRGNRIASLRNLVLGADKNNARGVMPATSSLRPTHQRRVGFLVVVSI